MLRCTHDEGGFLMCVMLKSLANIHIKCLLNGLITIFCLQGKYKVYNLCSERLYDASLFEGKVCCLSP